MSLAAPPPPPKRKNRKLVNSNRADVVVGSGYNAARVHSSNGVIFDEEVDIKNKKNVRKVEGNNAVDRRLLLDICNIEGIPDTVVGEGVEIHGELYFERLLRIDGKFQGVLQSKGDLIIGNSGSIVGDISTIRYLVVEGGHVIGNIEVDEIVLEDFSIVKGDITCKRIAVLGPNVSIVGKANIQLLSPECVDEENNLIRKKESLSLFKEESTPNKKFPIESSNKIQSVPYDTINPIENAREKLLADQIEAKRKRKEAKRLQKELLLQKNKPIPPINLNESWHSKEVIHKDDKKDTINKKEGISAVDSTHMVDIPTTLESQIPEKPTLESRPIEAITPIAKKEESLNSILSPADPNTWYKVVNDKNYNVLDESGVGKEAPEVIVSDQKSFVKIDELSEKLVEEQVIKEVDDHIKDENMGEKEKLEAELQPTFNETPAIDLTLNNDATELTIDAKDKVDDSKPMIEVEGNGDGLVIKEPAIVSNEQENLSESNKTDEGITTATVDKNHNDENLSEDQIARMESEEYSKLKAEL